MGLSDITNNPFLHTWKANDTFLKNGTFDPTNSTHWIKNKHGFHSSSGDT